MDVDGQQAAPGTGWLRRRLATAVRFLTMYGLLPNPHSSRPEQWFALGDGDKDDENLRLLYEKTFETLATFLDWRHKSMSLGFAVIAAAVALDEWLFIHSRQHWVLSAPLIVAAVFCVVVRKFDARNQTILNDAYQAGGELEKALGAASGAMMARIPTKRPRWTYHETIKVVFGWACIACTVGAFGSIAWSVLAAAHHHPARLPGTVTTKVHP